MKSTLKLMVLLLFTSRVSSQSGPPNNSVPDPNSCFNQTQLYTRTTDPNDNSQYSYAANSFNYGLNPNGVYGPTHFDWVNSTQITITTLLNNSASTKQIWSPFYPNGLSATSGGYGNLNLKNYQDIAAAQNLTTAQKQRAMDILPKDGWELLKYSFGTTAFPQPAPYFVLYNRYTGKIKYFAAITSDVQGMIANVNNLVVRASLAPYGAYDVFAYAQPFTHVLEDFDHVKNTNAAVTNAMQGMGGQNQYYWIYAEFMTSYDPCVCRQKGGAADMWFDIVQVTEQSVQLSAQGFVLPVPNDFTNLNNNGEFATSTKLDDNANLSTGQQIMSNPHAAIEGYKNWDEYASDFKDYFNTQTNNGTATNNYYITRMVNAMAEEKGQSNLSFSQKLLNAYQEINSAPEKYTKAYSGIDPDVKELASEVPKIGEYIGLLNSFMVLMDNDGIPVAGDPAPEAPTLYFLDTKVNGSITHQSSLVHSNFSLPGYYVNNDFSATNQGNEQVPYPIYNNPLGVFQIFDVPNFTYETITMANQGIDPNDANFGSQNWQQTGYNQFSVVNNTQQGGSAFPFDNAFHYKLSGPIKYVLNPASNLTVKSIDASIVLEYNGDDALTLQSNGKIFYNNGCSAQSPCYMLGNTNVAKQIPFYQDMNCETYMFTQPASMITDNLTTILDKITATGLVPEFASNNYVSPQGTNPSSEYIRFRTPYVPIQAAQNLNFVLMGSATSKPKTVLKLYCKFAKNSSPDDDAVVMVFTYDISDRLVNATSAGSGGSGTYYYYYSRDLGPQYQALDHTNNHSTLSKVSLTGAYNTANYGNPGPLTWTGGSTANNGVINVPNNSTIGQSFAANTSQFVSTMDDINIGDHVSLLASTNGNTSLDMVSFKNINIGIDFLIESTRNLYAGRSINVGDQFEIGNSTQPGPIFRANGNINLLHTGTGSSSIKTATLLAASQIRVDPGTLGEVEIKEESRLAAQYDLPPAYAFMNGYTTPSPVANNAASSNDIQSHCGSVYGQRIASHSKSDTSVVKQVKGSDVKKNDEANTLNDEFKITIFPNPAQGELNVNFLLTRSEIFDVSVEDVTGHMLQTASINGVPGINRNQINLSGFANGVYFVKVFSSERRMITSKKIILQK